MVRGWIFAGMLILSVCASCAAQVTGTFLLDKTVYAPGEPVFLTLTLLNEGGQPEEVTTADPYSFCSDYKIDIARQGSPRVDCFQGIAASCISGFVTLAPHASRTERILLNASNSSRGELNPPVRLPGEYTVDALRAIYYASPGAGAHRVGTRSDKPAHNEVHQILHLRVDETLALPPNVYRPFTQQLASQDDDLRSEAARTLATLAPPSLETLLLTFATSKDSVLRQFAPLALANLASKRSLSALAQLLVDAQPGASQSMAAAEYLGKTHDPGWFGVLLDVADRDGPAYLAYAAESGGDAAIAALLTRMHSTQPGVRSGAIDALGHTGSRAAVPILIGLLSAPASPKEDGFDDEAAVADGALQQLTRRFVAREATGVSVEEARRWQRWWLASGHDAPIYKPGACVPDTELP